jgi:predicted PurR-regulated permease PerM
MIMTDDAYRPVQKYLRANKLAILAAFLLWFILVALLAPKRRKEPEPSQAVREWVEKVIEKISKQWPKAKKQVHAIQEDLAAQAAQNLESLATQAEEISKSLAAQAQSISESVAAQAQNVGKSMAAEAKDIGTNVGARAQDISKKLSFWSR